MVSRLAPPAAVAGHPALLRAERLAADLLVPHAQRVDVEGLPYGHVEAARSAGLVGLSGWGQDADPPPAVLRAVTETLSGACGTTWFVLTQHALPLSMVGRSPHAHVRDRFLAPLAAGDLLAGVALAHVRRPGRPAVSARRSAEGWLLDGTVDWLTSWGLADVFLLAAQAGADLVFFLLDAVETPGLVSSGPVPLAAMGGSRTTSLRLSGLHVDAERLVDVVDRDSWLAADELRTANATPAVFGLLRAMVSELERTAARRASPEAAELAASLDAEGAELRSAAYALVDGVPPAEEVDERLRLRAATCELAVRAAGALIAAQAGGAMLRTSPAQRWAREALFHQVQAQTAPVRAAQLRRYAEVGRRAASNI